MMMHWRSFYLAAIPLVLFLNQSIEIRGTQKLRSRSSVLGERPSIIPHLLGKKLISTAPANAIDICLASSRLLILGVQDVEVSDH